MPKKKQKKKRLFDDLMQGMKEMEAYLQGKPGKWRVHHVYAPPKMDAAKVRRKLGLSQNEFALRFGIMPSTLRNWEQGRREPDPTTHTLLAIIDKHPEIVDEVLRGNQ
jgi:putative transcriptional regulator